MSGRRWLVLSMVVAAALPATAAAGSRQAAEKVRHGIAQFQAGHYQQAAESFAEADVVLPAHPRITFDRAVALAAQGNTARAEELLRQAAMSPDATLAARCRYNLGCLAAAEARQRFGEHPEQASGEVRQEGLALLAKAVGHFRDCLRLDADHADARHNLEMIRTWIKHMQALWSERDRQRDREETDLLRFLLALQQRQEELRLKAMALADLPDSPRRRQASRELHSAQQALADEIEPLKQKIAAEIGPAAPAAPGPAPRQQADLQQAVEALSAVADEAGGAMQTATRQLEAGKLADAPQSQAEAVERLDAIWSAIVPFDMLLVRSIGAQQQVIEQTEPLVSGPTDSEKTGGDPPAKVAADPAVVAEAGRQQAFIAGWAERLEPKAREGLRQLEQAGKAGAEKVGGKPSSGPKAGADPKAGSAEDEEAARRREGLRQSMQKALELGPKAHQLAAAAAELLKEPAVEPALAKEREALKVLEEIAEPLPKQQPQQSNQQDENRQQQPDQPSEGQPDGAPKERPEEPEAKPSEEMSRERAEAALRQARQRQQHRQEMERNLREQLYRPGKVEKDW